MTADLCMVAHARDPGRPRRAVPGLYLCDPCLGHLEQLVAELPALYDELDRALATGGGNGGPKVSGSSGEPLPINTAAFDQAEQIRKDLAWWCTYIAHQRGITPPASSHPTTTAPYLLRHLEWCAAHTSGYVTVIDLYDVMRELTGQTRAIVTPDRRLAVGERCRALDATGERCGGTIRLVLGGRDELWTARCTACGRQEAAPYMRDGVAGRWVTIERAQAYALRVHGVRVQPATVRKWGSRGHVRKKREHGATWYELGSVQTYLAARTERIAS